MSLAVSIVVAVVLVVVLLLVVQFVVRPRLGRRGKLAVDAYFGDIGAERELRRQLDHDVLSRLTPGAYQPGGYLMKGKAAKAMASLGRTFVLRADPAQVAAVLTPVFEQSRHFAPAAGGRDADEAAAWEAQSMFGPYPRVSVRASSILPGATEFGVTHYMWSLKFPQGAPMLDKVWEPALAALHAAGLVWSEQKRDFQPDADVRTDIGERDGRWHAAALVPIGPEMTKA